MKSMHGLAYWLVIIGALNWGLVGLGDWAGTAGGWNVVHMIFGSMMWLEDLVYVLVGLSALVLIFGGKKDMMSSGPAM